MADLLPVLTISYKPVKKGKKKDEPAANKRPSKGMQAIAKHFGGASRFLPKIANGSWWNVTKIFNEVVRLAGTVAWRILFPGAASGFSARDPKTPDGPPAPENPPSDRELKRNLSSIAAKIVKNYKAALNRDHPPASIAGEFLAKRSGALQKSVASKPGRGNTHKIGYNKKTKGRKPKKGRKTPFAPYRYGPMHIAHHGRKGIKSVVADAGVNNTFRGRVLVWSYAVGEDQPEV